MTPYNHLVKLNSSLLMMGEDIAQAQATQLLRMRRYKISSTVK